MLKKLQAGININLLCTLFISLTSYTGELYETFPSEINASEKYVFYSHGKIIEGKNPRPTHARWGTYDFPKVKAALSDNSYNLLAYHRPKNTKPREFARKLSANVHSLIAQGVNPENISLVGFSRGGEITILASSYVKSNDINIILLASCSGFMRDHPEFKVTGKVHSIYETSDGVGSCQFLIEQSEQAKKFEELAISTGKEHGAFYNPLPKWLIPVKKWLKGN